MTRAERRLRWLIEQCANSNVPLIITDPSRLRAAADLLRSQEAK